MTAVLETTPWSVMPGWGVVADLTPPELVELRRLRSLRKMIVATLVAVMVLCLAGFGYAMYREAGAQSGLDDIRAEGTTLVAASSKYGAVVRLRAQTDAVNAQIAQVMTVDVDMARLLASLRQAAPASVSLTSVNVSLTATDPATGAATTVAAGTARPPAGEAVIGTVTLSGTARRLNDLADYVQSLQKVPGVVDVLPANNAAGATGAANWSMTLSVTEKLYSHRYDLARTTGGNR